MPRVEIVLDLNALEGISRAAQDAAWETMWGVDGQVKNAKVVPMNNGDLQGSMNVSQVVDGDEIITSLNTDEPYARFQYNGKLMLAENGSSWAKKDAKKKTVAKDLVHQKGNNSNAQAKWLKPWLPGGDREDYVPETYAERLEVKLK